MEIHPPSKPGTAAEETLGSRVFVRDGDNHDVGRDEHGDLGSNTQSQEQEVEIVLEVEKEGNKERMLGLLDKKLKARKVKLKSNFGEKRKRKLSSNGDCHKKSKKKKREEILCDSNTALSAAKHNDITKENKAPEWSTEEATPIPVPDVEMLNSPDISPGETLKTLSARKLKSVINACKETLNALMAFDYELLHSMSASLKTLKEHNFLDNKLISTDTLIELIKLALETSKASEEVVTEKDMNFSKIISNLACKKTQQRNCKVRRNILNSSISPKGKTSDQSAPGEICCLGEEIVQVEVKPVGNAEDCLIIAEPPMADTECETSEKPGKNFITNYFKKLEKSCEERVGLDKFSWNRAKSDSCTAPRPGGGLSDSRRRKFEEELESQCSQINYLTESAFKSKIQMSNRKKRIASVQGKEIGLSGDSNTQEPCSDFVMTEFDKNSVPPAEEKCHATGKIRAKLLQFHDNRRPPYWGTWRRKSKAIRARNPLGKDQEFNYDVDSDDEWEGEEEAGESLHGSDDEKEPEEDYEVDNDFFVPHGYLSDDENPEKENVPLNAKLNYLEEQLSTELKQKSRKMTPVVCGVYWTHLEPKNSKVGSPYQDLQLDKLECVPWTSCPIIVNDEKKAQASLDQECLTQLKKSRMKVTFPAQQVPNLIKIIHGSPQNCDQLARKFLTHWQSVETGNLEHGKRSSLTKKCVLEKIKELATWQVSQDRKKMCWLVPKETQKEFGTEVEGETAVASAAKTPKKCYIWKFIKRMEKMNGATNRVVQDPELIVLEP